MTFPKANHIPESEHTLGQMAAIVLQQQVKRASAQYHCQAHRVSALSDIHSQKASRCRCRDVNVLPNSNHVFIGYQINWQELWVFHCRADKDNRLIPDKLSTQ